MTVGAPVAPVKFSQAVAWFRARTPTLGPDFDKLPGDAHARAFTVAGVEKLAVLDKVWRALDKAIANGTTLQDFKKEVSADLFAAWGKADSARLETVFRNNVQSAYSAGRYAAQTTPDALAARPFWMFSAVLDGRITPTCKPHAGLVLPATDPFWLSTYPPLHHRCRSQVISLRAAQAGKLAKRTSPDPAAEAPQGGWGKPRGLDAPVTSKAAPELVKALPAPPPKPAPRPVAPAKVKASPTDASFPAALHAAIDRHGPSGEVRDVVRGLLRRAGLHSFDLADENGERRPGAGSLTIAAPDNDVGAAAYAGASQGWIIFSRPLWNRAADAARALAAAGPSRAGDALRSMSGLDLNALTVLLHEELHGHSPALDGAIVGHGLGLEEAITEGLARVFVRRVGGLGSGDRTPGLALPRYDEQAGRFRGSGFLSYDAYLEDLYQAAFRVTGADAGELPARMERAMLATRSGAYKGLATPLEHFEAVAHALGRPGSGEALHDEFARLQRERGAPEQRVAPQVRRGEVAISPDAHAVLRKLQSGDRQGIRWTRALIEELQGSGLWSRDLPGDGLTKRGRAWLDAGGEAAPTSTTTSGPDPVARVVVPAPAPSPAAPVAVSVEGPRYDAPRLGGHVPEPGKPVPLDDLPAVDLKDLFRVEHRKHPSGEPEVDFKRRMAQKSIDLTDGQRQALREFTGRSYKRIRALESNPDAPPAELGMSPDVHEKTRRASADLNEGLRRAKPEPGTVFRGMSNMPESAVRAFLAQAPDFGMGVGGGGATASATWSPGVVSDVVLEGLRDGRAGTYKMFVSIRGRSQVGIEHLSEKPEEREMIFGKDARFKVVSVAKARGTSRVLVVELEEVDP